MKIGINNIRGGAGKTTSSIVISEILSKNNKVLTIDNDPQSSLTRYFFSNGSFNRKSPSLLDFILEGNKKAIYKINDNLDVIPNKLDHCNYFEYNIIPGTELLLFNQLDEIEDEYDYIIMDCNPTAGKWTQMSWVVADTVIVPVDMDPESIVGAQLVIDNIDEFKKTGLGHMIDVKKVFILPTKRKSFNSYERKKLKQLHKKFTDVLHPISNYNSKVSEQKENGKFTIKGLINDYEKAIERVIQ